MRWFINLGKKIKEKLEFQKEREKKALFVLKQINKVNKDCKSVSGTLARAALTSIALDGNQVKQFMEDDLGKKKKKEENEGEVGDIGGFEKWKKMNNKD